MNNEEVITRGNFEETIEPVIKLMMDKIMEVIETNADTDDEIRNALVECIAENNNILTKRINNLEAKVMFLTNLVNAIIKDKIPSYNINQEIEKYMDEIKKENPDKEF